MSTPPEKFLSSIGFDFEFSHSRPNYPNGYDFEKLLKRHHRIKCREENQPEEYGHIFEEVVFDLLYEKFDYDLLRKVEILGEGSGGDYDILAFSSPHLLYIECKTSSQIHFKHILDRHLFLRPALTIVLVDLQKELVSQIINDEIQPILTRYAKENDAAIAKKEGYKYPVELISNPGEAVRLFHTFRNIFIASGEDLERVVKKTLRHFHQIVQQTSYWN